MAKMTREEFKQGYTDWNGEQPDKQIASLLDISYTCYEMGYADGLKERSE